MKNGTAMYRLAKARALEHGPRRFKRYAGYALTDSELYEIYLMEGFSIDKKAMQRHIEAWRELGRVAPARVGEDENVVYFFTIDGTQDDDGRLIKALHLKFPDYGDDNLGVLAL